jgi:drug/metabolite transporter (DMT)-like permease
MLAAFLTTILFSISAVSATRTATLLGGSDANFWRLCVATLVLGAFAHLAGGGLAGAGFLIFLLSGCVGFGVGDIALFQAFPRIGSRLSVLLVLCLSSPIGALSEWLWLGTALSSAEIASGLTILGGVALALGPTGREERRTRGFVAGVGFGLVASLCQAGGAVLSRKAFALASAAGENIDGVTAAYQRILGGLALGAVFLLIVKKRTIARLLAAPKEAAWGGGPARVQTWRQVWPWVVVNGLAGPALGVSCFQWALKTTPTGVVLPIVAITPLVILPFSRYVEGERPSRRSLLGGLVAVAGAVALALAKRPPP